MRHARAWLMRLLGTLGTPRDNRELDDELESHVQLHIDDNVRAGMAPAEARRRAILALGGIEQTKERWRDQRGIPAIEQLLQDARYAVRVLRKTPGFAATAVMMLGLAIGANTAMFSVVYAVLVQPLPYPDADRLVRLAEEHPGGTPLVRDAVVSQVTLEAWQATARTIEQVAVYASRTYSVRFSGDAERLRGAAVSPELFELLGVTPALGAGPARGNRRPADADQAGVGGQCLMLLEVLARRQASAC